MYTCYTSQSEYSISFFWLSFHPQELKKPRTGVSTEGGGVTAASWKWYSLMDEALGARPSVTPPVLFASSSREVAGLPPPPVFTPPPCGHSSKWSFFHSVNPQKTEGRHCGHLGASSWQWQPRVWSYEGAGGAAPEKWWGQGETDNGGDGERGESL